MVQVMTARAKFRSAGPTVSGGRGQEAVTVVYAGAVTLFNNNHYHCTAAKQQAVYLLL